MLIRRDSLACKVLAHIGSPTQYLPALFWVMPVRIGNDCHTWCKVTLRRP